MPNSVSAKKRFRQSEDRRARNRAVRSSVRSLVRKVRAAVSAGDAAASEAAFRIAVKRLDQAVAKGVYHANTISRYKSRLSAAIKKVKVGK